MIEQKFQEFRKSIAPGEFNSIEFLTARAQQLEADDPDLSQRILVRVTNLKREKQKKAEEAKKEEALAKAKQEEVQEKRVEPKSEVISTPAAKPAEEQKKKAEHKAKGKLSHLISSNPLLNKLKQSPFTALVLVPTLIFAFYQLFWATERFESQAQVIVQQPDGMATMDASMAVLTGLGMPSTGVSDTELVKAYILSNDMLRYLEDKLNLSAHYSQSEIDVFSRLDSDSSWESFFEFYQKHINVFIDAKSNIVFVQGQGFDADFAHRLTQTIVDRAEWYINSIGHQLAEAQLEFIKNEHANIQSRLEEAQATLLNFQQRYNLLDPAAEGMAMQQIAYGLEGQISAKEAELKSLNAIMSDQAPQVRALQNQLTALKEQLVKERGKLSADDEQVIPVSEILANYTDLKVKMELALQAYTSSEVSLEKSRIEAYRQLKYLVVVEAATLPQDSKYPHALYNISLFALVTMMLFAIGKIIISTIRELK
ncbi:lipopolysaccharide biosynthesis protein [Vibrio astriarenae]|uniref:Lipopolysaccharide biosynthesis protein n=1 Tax=Vibrio astriarenae TaxID=1481923 RepID=A0A7Z2T4V3_9VIBR|nr:lipopolysaccharide biosynthesis protein [Vibrio astriarenae]QIA64464.1 lipopolysaccharide biosynthesis protein [Vibrio astriarenae]